MCVCERVTDNGAVWWLHIRCQTKGLHRPLESQSSEAPGAERWPKGGSRFPAGSQNCRAEGPPRLNFLSIKGVNLTFQRLDKAAQSCLLLNLIC